MEGTIVTTMTTLIKLPGVALWVSLAWVAASAQPATTTPQMPPLPSLTTVQSLDVTRYMGTWFEIAKYPNRFQSQCFADTQAQYQLQADGGVQVINRCRKDTGEMVQAVGAARQVGSMESPKLKVRFAPVWLSWLPLVWGDYWVIDLDPDYRLVAISEPDRQYLWVLSRTVQVDAKDYAALMLRLQGQGFDLRRLERTQHARQP